MGYLLNGVSIPNPYKMSRQSVEIAKTNITLDGYSRKDIVRQKEIFVLEFKMLSQSQVTSLVNIFSLKVPVSFSVNDGSLVISQKNVFVNISDRSYNTRGSEYREDLKLTLEEV